MRRTLLAAAVCLSGVLTGCGSSSPTPTTPASAGSTNGSSASGGALTRTGPVGKVGSPTAGKFSTADPNVLKQIDSRLVTYYTGKGFTGVTAICNARKQTTATCRVTGTNSTSQTSSAIITVTLDPSTGLLKVVRAAP